MAIIGNMTGVPGSNGGTTSTTPAFLQTCIGYEDEDYLYCSCNKDNGDWVVNRYHRETQIKTVADIANNAGQATKPSDLVTLQGLAYS